MRKVEKMGNVRLQALAAFAALPLMVGAGSADALAEKLQYTRADLLEAQTGQVEIRRGDTRPLILPLPSCPEGPPYSCSQDVIYGQVYELTFVSERLLREHDATTTTRTDRGRLLVALAFPKKTADAFEDSLRNEIAALSPAAFMQAQAGMGYLKGALGEMEVPDDTHVGVPVLFQSERPAWVCTELQGVTTCDVLVQVPRDPGAPVPSTPLFATYNADGEIANRAGGSIARSVDDLPPTIVRTPPDVLAQQRTEVHFRSASTLAGRTWSDRLAPVPKETTFTKRPLAAGKLTGGVRDMRNGVFRGHEGRYGESDRDVRLPPASLELLDVPLWVGEWRFETTRETFGDEPTVQHDPVVSFTLAVAPIADPLMEDLVRSRTPLTVPTDRLMDFLLKLFQHSARLDPVLIEEAFADPQLWPSGGDWLIVGCASDDTARYGIAPFAGAAKVTNPREACTAIRRELH